MKLFIASFCICASFSFATESSITGVPISIETHSASHPIAAVRNYVVFQIVGNTKACMKLYFPDSEKAILANLLSAKASGTSIIANVEDASTAPWGSSGTCRVNSLVSP
jgi:hypothetical protein